MKLSLSVLYKNKNSWSFFGFLKTSLRDKSRSEINLFLFEFILILHL